jgi:type VI secretion system protein ImpA
MSTSNPAAYKTALANGDVPLERIRETASRTPVAFYQNLLNRQQICAVAVSELETMLDATCGSDAPSFSSLLAMLAKIERMIGVFAGNRMPQLQSEAPAPNLGKNESPGSPLPLGPLTQASHTISGRQHAFEILDQVANYLLAVEPHSPVPYLIKRAIRWGNMPLGNLIAELVDEDDRTRRILNLLSISG